MDALALLCTLHADGPLTLRALRSAGCHSLVDLGQCDTNELAQFLKLSVPSAERFQREAELLRSRLTPLQPEVGRESDDELVPSLSAEAEDEGEELQVEAEEPRVVRPLPPALAGSRANRSWFSATQIPLLAARARTNFASQPLPASPTTTDEPILEEPKPALPIEVRAETETQEESGAIDALELERARHEIEELATEHPEPVEEELEEAAAATIFVAPAPELVAIAPELTIVTESTERLVLAAADRAELPEPEPQTPEPSVQAGPTPLQIGQPDGLDGELLAALEAAGIRTAEDLVQASGLELSRDLGVPFTRLLELQLGAQHLFRRSNTLVPQRRPERRPLEPSLEPRPEPATTGSLKRRHTDAPRVQTHAQSGERRAQSRLSDAFDSPSNGSVGGPFA